MIRPPASHEVPTDLLLLDDGDDRRTRQTALLAALLLHGIAITISLPALGHREVPARPRVPSPVRLQPLPVIEPPTRRPRPAVETDDLAVLLLPVPDPTPDSLEPVNEPRPATPSLPIGVEGPAVLMADPVPPPSSGPLWPDVDRSVSYPTLIESSRVLPVYPGKARQARLEGQVILRAVVQRDGSVGTIEVLRSPARGYGFEEEAIRAVRQWRYHPGVQHGRPVDVYFTVVVDFVLD